MEIWDRFKLSASPNDTFETFLSNQAEVIQLLKRCEASNNIGLIHITAKPGNGVSHLIGAICNKLKNERGYTVANISGESLLYIYKRLITIEQINAFKNFLLSYNALAIDNSQCLFRKKDCTDFIFNLIGIFLANKKSVIIGCSMPEKNITKLKRFKYLKQLNEVTLKPLQSEYIYKVLQKLCEYEPGIPDWILYDISNYIAPIQKHINCLISIRFKSKANGLDLRSISNIEFNKIFNLDRYFENPEIIQLELEKIESPIYNAILPSSHE